AEAAAKAFAIDAARLLSDNHCDDVVVVDVRRLSPVSDFLVIGSGTSDRQMRGTADDVSELAERSSMPIFRREVDDRTTWYVLDCVDVVVHIFEPATRGHYDLEMLWGEAPRVEWARAGEPTDAPSRDRAGLRRSAKSDRRSPG